MLIKSNSNKCVAYSQEDFLFKIDHQPSRRTVRKKDQLLVNIQCCLNYYSQPKTRNIKIMLNSHTIIAERLKNIFQPANPTILPETPQIPALSGERLLDGLNLISQ
jgi:hypothetical protein